MKHQKNRRREHMEEQMSFERPDDRYPARTYAEALADGEFYAHKLTATEAPPAPSPKRKKSRQGSSLELLTGFAPKPAGFSDGILRKPATSTNQ